MGQGVDQGDEPAVVDAAVGARQRARADLDDEPSGGADDGVGRHISNSSDGPRLTQGRPPPVRRRAVGPALRDRRAVRQRCTTYAGGMSQTIDPAVVEHVTALAERRARRLAPARPDVPRREGRGPAAARRRRRRRDRRGHRRQRRGPRARPRRGHEREPAGPAAPRRGARRRRRRRRCATSRRCPTRSARSCAGSTLANGLQIRQVRVPMGVIGMIYEARPNVTVDAAASASSPATPSSFAAARAAASSNHALVEAMRESPCGTRTPGRRGHACSRRAATTPPGPS